MEEFTMWLSGIGMFLIFAAVTAVGYFAARKAMILHANAQEKAPATPPETPTGGMPAAELESDAEFVTEPTAPARDSRTQRSAVQPPEAQPWPQAGTVCPPGTSGLEDLPFAAAPDNPVTPPPKRAQAAPDTRELWRQVEQEEAEGRFSAACTEEPQRQSDVQEQAGAHCPPPPPALDDLPFDRPEPRKRPVKTVFATDFETE